MRVLPLIVMALLWGGCALGSRFGDDIELTGGPQITPEGVRFSLYSTKVKTVHITGDFNNWSMTADPLYDRGGTGMWTIVLPLSPGRYEYKIVVNGDKLMPDPSNPLTVDDGFGDKNSVFIVE